MDRVALKAIADQIDTGAGDLEVARALVVFNLSADVVAGVACFPSDISWWIDKPMPSISVASLDGARCPSAVRSVDQRPDPKGRPNRCRLSFDLLFEVSDVPALGWQTYIASYADGVAAVEVAADACVDLVVVETGFHRGRLPSTGCAADFAVSLS